MAQSEVKLVDCLFVQSGLVALERKQVVSFLCDDLTCYLTLCADGVNGDGLPLNVELVKKAFDGSYLIFVFPQMFLTECNPLLTCPSTDGVHGTLFQSMATPQALTIQGDDLFP